MSGYYPDGCTQADHDRAFDELGPSPDELFDEAQADEDRAEEDRERARERERESALAIGAGPSGDDNPDDGLGMMSDADLDRYFEERKGWEGVRYV